MQLSTVIKTYQQYASDNAPAILTSAAVIGTVTTAVLSGRATLKAHAIVQDELDVRQHHELWKDVPLTRKELVKLTWLAYLPPTVAGAMTIASIVASHQVSNRRAAAVATAYVIAEKGYNEYRDKVIEKLGDNKERQIRDELVQERMERTSMNSQVVVTGTGNVPCFDGYTGRYFMSTMEDIKGAQNDTNYQILSQGYASLTSFYDRIGLSATDVSDDVGWTTDHKIDISFSWTGAEDGRTPALGMVFRVVPVRHFDRMS